MHSAIYEGTIRHRRFRPTVNQFRYPIFMMYVDLMELQDIFNAHIFWSVDRFNLAYFHRADHTGNPQVSLDQTIRTLVAERNGRSLLGPIRLLTHFRYLGHCFNPVSFYYCFDKEGDKVQTIVAEVNNTPWREQYCYVLDEGHNEGKGHWKRFRFIKDFHVSPFMAMSQDYDWRFAEPTNTIRVHMDTYERGKQMFDATLNLQRREMTRSRLNYVLIRYPIQTLAILARIYRQAFKLWRKHVPAYTHPAKIKAEER